MLNLYELVLLLANKSAFGGKTERSFMLNLFELVLLKRTRVGVPVTSRRVSCSVTESSSPLVHPDNLRLLCC